MEGHLVDAVCREVYRRHPEVKDARPEKRAQGNNTLFIFKSRQKTEDGKSITHTIRAVVDSDGKILKLTVSR